MTDFLKEAICRMRADGLAVDDPNPDGNLHRCPTEGRERGRDGAYIYHADKVQTVWWKNWRTGVTNVYCSKLREAMTPGQQREHDAFIAECRKRAAADRKRRETAGARAAVALWNSAEPASGGHPYLEAKGVALPDGLRMRHIKGFGNTLLVPVYDPEGQLASVQRIPDHKIDGRWLKLFVRDGRTGGCYFPIAGDGGKDGPLLIAEGLATGASLHEATGHACLVAFNAASLLAVARMARDRYPTRAICICGDYDAASNIFPNAGGIGAAKARAAANAIGASLAICPDAGPGITDFNDLAQKSGPESVAAIIRKALASGPVTVCPMPPDFRLVRKGKAAGLYHLQAKSDGTVDEILLGPVLDVLAATRDADGHEWGLMLGWHDPDELKHTWAMPKSILYAQNGDWFATLASGGWFGNPACRKLIGAFLASVRPLRRVRCVASTGWHVDRYVLPDAVYGEGEDDLVLQSPHYDDIYKSGGTYQGWREIADLCAGNSRLGFALAVAFAGPLLQIAGLDPAASHLRAALPSASPRLCGLRQASGAAR